VLTPVMQQHRETRSDYPGDGPFGGEQRGIGGPSPEGASARQEGKDEARWLSTEGGSEHGARTAEVEGSGAQGARRHPISRWMGSRGWRGDFCKKR
jgi:hypothetical protein